MNMDLFSSLRFYTSEALSLTYNVSIDPEVINIEQTSPDFSGDFSIVVFPLLKHSRKSPEETATVIGNHLIRNLPIIDHYEIIKGYLNIILKPEFWVGFLMDLKNGTVRLNHESQSPKKILVEFSSPNTNKPLHLGHIRNNLIGYAVTEILKLRGHQVIKVNLVNDRGIHICKSMIAWIKYGNSESPASSGIKGDHLVGKYYVLFDKKYREEVKVLSGQGRTIEEAEKEAPLMLEAQALLRKWEMGDEKVMKIWKEMNDWTYSGFSITYQNLGISFDKTYYESSTYLKGKNIIQEGLASGVFYRKEDGSVWVTQLDDDLDEKLLLRADGTSVYMTQDLGTAETRYDEFNPDMMIYVVGDEQDHHFKVLKAILKKMNKKYHDSIYHLSYGMIDLPEGKMKSREGNVVDADDLMDEMKDFAIKYLLNSGKYETISEQERGLIAECVGLAALKFYILKADARKRMVFNPEESIDLQGFTGPFVQYTYARIKSVFRKGEIKEINNFDFPVKTDISPSERDVLKIIYHFDSVLANVEKNLEPSEIAHYVYRLAKTYNQFYHDFPILKEGDKNKKALMLHLSDQVGIVIEICFKLLGIRAIEKM
jgi:arginyl-tRNA synthetase